MNFLVLTKLKMSILIRKHILSMLLIFLHPTAKIMVFLSQDLDKYIVLYQKRLFSIYIHNNMSNKGNKFVAW
jgi:hypothetical protein